MTSKSNIDFSIPRRQSYVAILMMIWKTYRTMFSQMLPFLIIAFVGSGSSKGSYVFYTVLAIAVLVMIYSIIAFFRYYFYVEDDKLVVERGVFGRSKTIIPFDRIQTINFEKNIVHQAFSVLRLKIDTAGSAKKEFEFDAISEEVGEELRALVLAHKEEHKSSLAETDEAILAAQRTSQEDSIYKTVLELELSDLLKVGITQNHFRSIGLILLALIWVVETLDQAEVNVWDMAEQNNPFAYGLMLVVMVAVAFLVLSILVSLVTTFLKYYGLIFSRSDNGFKLNAGLLTKKDTSALDHKIQMVSWSDNILRKLLGIFDLYLKQASSVEVVNKKSIKVPGCRQDAIDLVTHSLYGADALEGIEMHGVHQSYMWRRMIFMSLLCIPVCLIAFLSDRPWIYGIAAILWILIIVSSVLKYRKLKYGYNDRMFKLRGGFIGDKATVLPIHKIQNVQMHQSPYQRRKELASVELHTAAGSITVPYIPKEDAVRMSNYILYLVESSKKRWM